MLTFYIHCYLNEYHLTKYVCIFVTKKDSEMPVLDPDFTFWQIQFTLDPFVVESMWLFIAIFNLRNKNLILFVTPSY